MDPYDVYEGAPYSGGGGGSSLWGDWSNLSFARIMGFSFIASLFSKSYILDSAKLLVLGSLIETGRRLFQWLIERFRFQYSITAQFDEGDPAYEWIVLFLTQQDVWKRSRDFRVNAKNSKRKWNVSVKHKPSFADDAADYVPTYEMPQLFRWNGYWHEIKRSKTTQMMPHHGTHVAATIFVTIYTLDMSVLSALVEEARKRYVEVSRPHVTVYLADMPSYGPGFVWNNVKRKTRRPLSSIILLEGIIDSLIKDAQEFIAAEDWYVNAGIPHRRGYLLYGPPGTGKTSTIYALAGELGLEIYTLSLSSGFVDDSFLQKAASSLPKNSIFLIEDIDCAFPTRSEDEDDEEEKPSMTGYGPVPLVRHMLPGGRRSAVTLSGLLNVLDGVGSEEGKLFFATTNYVDKLDSALLRPGRIDKKVQYNLATQEQASALFMRFYGESHTPSPKLNGSTNIDLTEKPSALSTPSIATPSLPPAPVDLADLSGSFADHIPIHTFSTAELQGYLLIHKHDPTAALDNVKGWVDHEMKERAEKEERAEMRKRKIREKRMNGGQGNGGMGMGMGMGNVGMLARGPVVGGLQIPMGAEVARSVMEVDTPAAPVSPSPEMKEGNVDLENEVQPPHGLALMIESDSTSKRVADVGSDRPSTLTSPF